MTDFEPQVFGSPDRAITLRDWLQDFYNIFDADLDELRFLLKQSWQRQTGELPFHLTRDAIYKPDIRIEKDQHKVPFSKTIRIRTTIEKKWINCAMVALLEGFNPIRDFPKVDEEKFHGIIQELDEEFPSGFPVQMAKAKQGFDLYETSLLTLDTVSYVDGMLLHKAHNPDEAIKLITQISGKHIMTETGWVLGTRLMSGATVQLLNSTRLSYTMKTIPTNEIDEYVQTLVPFVPVTAGMDLSITPVRMRYVDTTTPIIYSASNSFGHGGSLTLPGEDLAISLFNPLFAGVPIHAIRALLLELEEIYKNADPF